MIRVTTNNREADDAKQKQAMSPEERQRQVEQQQQLIAQRSAAIKHKFAIISGKGGVGKTTVAVGLAAVLAAEGHSVGLLDTDITGPNIPLMMGLEGQRPRASESGDAILPVSTSAGIKVMSMGMLTQHPDTPVIWRGPLRGIAVQQLIADVEWGPLDYFIIDMPPGTGDEPLTIAQSLPQIDGMIIVSTPQEASLVDCRKAINFVRQLDLEVLGVIENMSGFICPHCGQETAIFGSGGAEDMAKQMGVSFLGRLPIVPEVVQLTDNGVRVNGPTVPQVFRCGMDNIVVNWSAVIQSGTDS